MAEIPFFYKNLFYYMIEITSCGLPETRKFILLFVLLIESGHWPILFFLFHEHTTHKKMEWHQMKLLASSHECLF